MSRVLSIDYGLKRCGVAVTDSLGISLNPLGTFHPDKLIPFIKNYNDLEEVATLIIGWPTHSDGTATKLTKQIQSFLSNFAKLFPKIKIVKIDESFSSSEAKALIYKMGVKRKKRQSKELVDTTSALLLLKRYLERI